MGNQNSFSAGWPATVWPCRHACHDRVQMPGNGTDAVSLFFLSFCAVYVEWRQTDLGKGEVRCMCASCVSAGVSDNEMQQGTKSWGPLFSRLQLHFHSRQSMILPYPLSCVCVCVFMFVWAGCCVYKYPLHLLLVFCMADPPNVITVSACLIYSRRE